MLRIVLCMLVGGAVALQMPAAALPHRMQSATARPLSTAASRAPVAHIRADADGADGETRRSGVSKGQLIDAIVLRAGVSKKTAELVLSAGASAGPVLAESRRTHACPLGHSTDADCPAQPPPKRLSHFASAALDVIVETVANGDKVTLVNFGTFDSKKRPAREGRNPQTNLPMHIPGALRGLAPWPAGGGGPRGLER